jgi:hypothetical protein
MLRSFSSIFLFLVCTVAAFAQTDTTYVIKRNGTEARFVFKKSANLTQVRNYSPVSFPVYTMTRAQHNRIRDLLYTFVEMENNFEMLKADYSAKDSVFSAKEASLTHAYQTQESRASNFENSYNKLLTINARLDENLKKCEQLAKTEHRKKNRKSAIVGVLSAAAGLLVGAAVF